MRPTRDPAAGEANVCDVGDEVRRALAGLRSELEAEFGRAVLELAAVVVPSRRLVEISGVVASARTADRVADTASAAAPGWRIDQCRLTEIRTDEWRGLPPGVTGLSRSLVGRSLSSELVPADGPVEVLADDANATLVRTPRGTLGWIGRSLGERTAPPVVRRPREVSPLSAVAATWLGTPYRLGGTLPGGIDCSGLLLRCFAASRGVRLPRHSTDQVPDDLVARHDRIGKEDVVILRDRAGLSHVGLVVSLGRAGPIVVHASASRGRVVAEPLDQLAASFVDMGVATPNDLLELHGASA